MMRARRNPASRSEPPFGHRNLPLLLLQAREAVLAHFRPVLQAHGVNEQQWRILRALLESGALEPRQIGEQCRISSPSLAGVLARMDDLGLVQRARVADDQRRVMVSLSPHSQALVGVMAPQIEAVYQRIEAHMGAEAISRFDATLDEMVALLQGLPDSAPDAG